MKLDYYEAIPQLHAAARRERAQAIGLPVALARLFGLFFFEFAIFFQWQEPPFERGRRLVGKSSGFHVIVSASRLMPLLRSNT